MFLQISSSLPFHYMFWQHLGSESSNTFKLCAIYRTQTISLLHLQSDRNMFGNSEHTRARFWSSYKTWRPGNICSEFCVSGWIWTLLFCHNAWANKLCWELDTPWMHSELKITLLLVIPLGTMLLPVDLLWVTDALGLPQLGLALAISMLGKLCLSAVFKQLLMLQFLLWVTVK